MTKDEKNRAIAKWLGWYKHGGYWYSPDSRDDWENRSEKYPDFFTSEEASALVLEKMAPGRLDRENSG